MKHKDFLGCEHPIVCLPMNRVSNIDLAIAVAKAGCLPSVIMVTYSSEEGTIFREEKFVKDMLKFRLITGGCNIIVSMTDFFLELHHERLMKMIDLFGISYVEILPYYGNQVLNLKKGEGLKENTYDLKKYIKHLVNIKSKGCKVIVKCLAYPIEPVSESLVKNGVIDAIIIKCSKGAGKASPFYDDLVKLITKIKNRYPTVHIIASGGVSTPKDIAACLEAGATAVGIGTIFALSKESRISNETKQAIISKTSKDITVIGKTGLGLNAIVIKEYRGPDDDNFSQSLDLGVKGLGGHLYIGHGIDQVDEIFSVSDIVKRLTA
jgi:NAD(P)H-dependent flavin oxidoreductase YrpB (nitropropane dioxygenase family)